MGFVEKTPVSLSHDQKISHVLVRGEESYLIYIILNHGGPEANNRAQPEARGLKRDTERIVSVPHRGNFS